jgi:predicted nucleotidyltransferase
MDDMVDAARVVLDELVASVRATLGDRLVGLYLYGSLLWGDFDPEASDLDLVAVLSDDVADPLFERLDALHLAFVEAHPKWTNRLDIVYVRRETLAGFRSGEGSFAVISPGEPFHLRTDVADWIQSWYLLRETSVPLVGPDAAELMPPIARGEFVAALVADLPDLGARSVEAEPGALAYGVLTACRALQTIRTDSMPSKTEAAAWAAREFPEWALLIDGALACRHSRGSVGFDDDATREAARRFIAHVADEIAGGTNPGTA